MKGFNTYILDAKKGDIVVVGNRSDSQIKALELGANAVVVTCGFTPDEEVCKKAVELGVYEITPVMTARCVSRPDDSKMSKKIARYNANAVKKLFL